MKKAFLVGLSLLVIGAAANASSDESSCTRPLLDLRIQMDFIASNIANINTTRTPEGGPYQAKHFVCDGGGCDVVVSPGEILAYEPDHPDASADGYVAYPDINLMDEMALMTSASRRYEELSAKCSVERK